jgi:hypothetical protein
VSRAFDRCLEASGKDDGENDDEPPRLKPNVNK